MKKGCSGFADTPAHRLVEEFIYVGRLHKKVLDDQVDKTGLYRGQYGLLMHISENPDASQKELAECGHISTATIAVALKKLEKNGYISREVDQKDNRVNQIRMTPKGEAVIGHGKAEFQKLEERMLQGFTPKEMEQFQAYFERVKENLLAVYREEKTERT